MISSFFFPYTRVLWFLVSLPVRHDGIKAADTRIKWEGCWEGSRSAGLRRAYLCRCFHGLHAAADRLVMTRSQSGTRKLCKIPWLLLMTSSINFVPSYASARWLSLQQLKGTVIGSPMNEAKCIDRRTHEQAVVNHWQRFHLISDGARSVRSYLPVEHEIILQPLPL